MSIFVDENTKVIYQGLTGSQGKYYGLLNRDYGTKVVAGTNPKKAGTDVDGIPVFASVADAVKATGATASCVFIPAPGVKSAVMEAAEGGVTFIVVITEGVPAHDEAWFFSKLKRDFPGVRLLGPNCPGIISPGKCNIGITAGHIAKAGGPVGIVSRSGTLTYQALYELKQKGIGVTTCVGIGGDPVPGTSFIDCLEAFQADPETKAVMMIGEIGGSAEEEAAEFIRTKMDQAGRLLRRRCHRALPARRWVTRAPSSRAARARPKPRWMRCAPRASQVGHNPTEAGELMAALDSHPDLMHSVGVLRVSTAVDHQRERLERPRDVRAKLIILIIATSAVIAFGFAADRNNDDHVDTAGDGAALDESIDGAGTSVGAAASPSDTVGAPSTTGTHRVDHRRRRPTASRRSSSRPTGAVTIVLAQGRLAVSRAHAVRW